MVRALAKAIPFIILAAFCFAAVPARAQFGFLKQGLDAVSGGKTSDAAAPGGAPSAKALKQAATFKNAARGFEFTIPAGWELVDGDPASESCSFRNMAGSMGFNMHIEQMVKSFPRAAAVKAGLKSDKERIEINKILSAKRRDDGNPKKKCGVIGWEIVQAPQKNSFQRIIWQCYDGQNFYMNFMAYSANKDFAAARPTLENIMKSIKFCK